MWHWVTAVENVFVHHINKLHYKTISNCNNILLYYILLDLFDQINTFWWEDFHKTSYWPQTFVYGNRLYAICFANLKTEHVVKVRLHICFQLESFSHFFLRLYVAQMGKHCCPANYKCDVTRVACIKGDVVIPWYNKISAQSTPAPSVDLGAVECDERLSCSADSTCCLLSTGEWGCCPLPEVQ